MRRRSIRFRLTIWYAAALAVTCAVTGIAMWWGIRDSIHDTVDRDLRTRMRAMQGFLATEKLDHGLGPLEEELIEEAAIAPAGIQYRIASADGRWIYRSPGTNSWAPAPPGEPVLTKAGRAETLVVNGRPFRVLSAAGPQGAIQIGAPIDEMYEMLDHFTWAALLASPAVLLLASFGGYWVSGRSLAPIAQIATAAEQIEAQNLSRRLPMAGTGDELDRLSATLNSMFGRLEQAFGRMVQFTADASHELRTPVAIIRTTAEVVRSKPRTEAEYAAALDRIIAASERATALIEDLMLLARADAGIDSIASEQLNLSDLVIETSAEARVLAESANLSLRCDTPTPCEILGDAQALRRLLLILLDNAIKYTLPGGEVGIAVEVEKGGEERKAIVHVRDTGIGIAEGDLPHIFDRFYRAGQDRSRQTGGSGLGLSIARWIAERHHGEICVVSHPGEGSLFSLTLPRAAEK